MNEYLKNLDRIEFVMTYACTGKCKHCSEGESLSCRDKIDGKIAAEMIKAVCKHYEIKTLMTFGGEPLLAVDEVCLIHQTATEMGIPKRQIITNGYFSTDKNIISETAKRLSESGVNDVLLSVDAFHQETIPAETVKTFAEALLKENVSVRLSPAWLVSKTDKNPYNEKTVEVLRIFKDMGIPESDGNIVFPEGNARIYLKEYFDLTKPHVNPYAEDPKNVKTLSISPNGDVLDGNIYKNSILDIITNYGG
jgi:MoaA/NifB/PqqE/SkfB family radical SAM enzyme